jgi:hypothetical protein
MNMINYLRVKLACIQEVINLQKTVLRAFDQYSDGLTTRKELEFSIRTSARTVEIRIYKSISKLPA